MGNIKSIVSVGRHQTYDLEVDHPDHQFYLANGMLTSNSHAVAYAFDSYYAAWLHTYYEKDWLATILQSESGNPDGLSKTIDEIKQMGYKFAQADINFSGDEWVFSEDIQAFVPPLGSVKGLGTNAMNEILRNRPYKSLDDLLFDENGRWKHSRLNKTCFSALCKIEALGSLDDFSNGRIENHRQIFLILTSGNNYERLKKGRYDMTRSAVKKRQAAGEAPQDILEQIIHENQGVSDWTRREKISNFVDLTSSSPTYLMFPEEIVQKLKKKNVKSVLELNDGETNVAWFCITSIIEGKTKNGKTFLKLGITDTESRVGSMRVWGKPNLSEVEPYTLWIGEVKKDDWGFSTTSWKMKKIELSY